MDKGRALRLDEQRDQDKYVKRIRRISGNGVKNEHQLNQGLDSARGLTGSLGAGQWLS